MSEDRGGFRSLLPPGETVVKFAFQGSAGLALSGGGSLVYNKVIQLLVYLFTLAEQHSFGAVVLAASLLILFVGAVLFWVRGRFPITYGTIEVVAGVIAAVTALSPAGIQDLLTPRSIIQVVGGIYIIVRGLDNIGKGVKGTALEPRWNRWFTPR